MILIRGRVYAAVSRKRIGDLPLVVYISVLVLDAKLLYTVVVVLALGLV